MCRLQIDMNCGIFVSYYIILSGLRLSMALYDDDDDSDAVLIQYTHNHKFCFCSSYSTTIIGLRVRDTFVDTEMLNIDVY